MRNASIRCFIAIEVPDCIQQVFEETQNALKSSISKASWTRFGNFHLTLKFLGDVKQDRISEICDTIENVSKKHETFTLDFGGIGAFPNMLRPRVLWIGLSHGKADTTELARAINSELAHLGFKYDSRFHPHVTLTRLRKHVNLERLKSLFQKYQTLQDALMTVDEVTLVKSDLHPSGAVYTPIKKFQLGREIFDNGE